MTELFKKCADNDAILNASSEMGVIFDAYYKVGLVFKNELDIDFKRAYELPDYPRSFDLNIIDGQSIRD